MLTKGEIEKKYPGKKLEKIKYIFIGKRFRKYWYNIRFKIIKNNNSFGK